MPKGTQIDPAQVNQQASMHEQKRDDIVSQLKNVRVTVDDVMQHSKSGMTQALAEQGEKWIDAVEKSVLAHMSAMADNIRAAASDQGEANMENVKQINNIPVATKSFLGM
ncbi:hypothetical protein [Amycolatopsis sp. PS_44_ISF1]|uniref:hypothetical protein n=1 Tax=Amycolatopsis sp. PS_44_ISF1 TaxID=2974917 RepID=UPI0028E08A88|nr:hypothetical protein [Amycolatopsis sp. PS_44_ISF1]MDT8912070.1 hypothetical protein [Amycolatopsis sp. PS_44_ISF1]